MDHLLKFWLSGDLRCNIFLIKLHVSALHEITNRQSELSSDNNKSVFHYSVGIKTFILYPKSGRPSCSVCFHRFTKTFCFSDSEPGSVSAA